MAQGNERAPGARPPRALRRQVERSLRKAILTAVVGISTRDGRPALVLDSPRAGRSPTGRYVWLVSLPDGQGIWFLTNYPTPPAERSYFPLVVEAIADAVYRGTSICGFDVQHAPECAPAPDECRCSPKVVVIERQPATCDVDPSNFDMGRLEGISRI
jgi:hypothetical protein